MPRQDKAIDRFGGPLFIAHLRKRVTAYRLLRPKLATFLDRQAALHRCDLADARIGGPRSDPTFEVCDDVVGQSPLGRHFVAVVVQRLNEQALAGLADDDRRAAFAPRE